MSHFYMEQIIKKHGEDLAREWLQRIQIYKQELKEEVVDPPKEGIESKVFIGKEKVYKFFVQKDRYLQAKSLSDVFSSHTSAGLHAIDAVDNKLLLVYPKLLSKEKIEDQDALIALKDLHNTPPPKNLISMEDFWIQIEAQTNHRLEDVEIDPWKENLIRQAVLLGKEITKSDKLHLLHGDIHRENILFTEKGIPVLIDHVPKIGDPACDYAQWIIKSTWKMREFDYRNHPFYEIENVDQWVFIWAPIFALSLHYFNWAENDDLYNLWQRAGKHWVDYHKSLIHKNS